jgi:hypothetical protein
VREVGEALHRHVVEAGGQPEAEVDLRVEGRSRQPIQKLRELRRDQRLAVAAAPAQLRAVVRQQSVVAAPRAERRQWSGGGGGGVRRRLQLLGFGVAGRKIVEGSWSSMSLPLVKIILMTYSVEVD